MTNIEKFAALVNAGLSKDAQIDKDAVFGFLAGLAGRGVGMAARAGGAIARGGGAIGRAAGAAGQAVGGYVKALPSAYRAGVVAGKGITSLPAARGPIIQPGGAARRGVERLKAVRAGAAPAVQGQAIKIPSSAMAPAPARVPPPVGLSAKPSPSGKIMMSSPTAKKGGRKAKTPVGAKPADAPGGGGGATAAMMAAPMLVPGGSSEEGKTSMNLKAIIEKTAELAKGASDEDKVAILAQVAMGDGFDGELLSQAQALGYDARISKTAADEKEEEEEAEEKDEKKDKKDEEKEEKDEKKDLPPWLQKKTDKKDDDKKDEKKEDEKKSSARPILYNKFTAHDIAAHLQSQFGRQDPVEKDASVKKVSASEKLAALVEKELAARPT